MSTRRLYAGNRRTPSWRRPARRPRPTTWASFASSICRPAIITSWWCTCPRSGTTSPRRDLAMPTRTIPVLGASPRTSGGGPRRPRQQGRERDARALPAGTALDQSRGFQRRAARPGRAHDPHPAGCRRRASLDSARWGGDRRQDSRACRHGNARRRRRRVHDTGRAGRCDRHKCECPGGTRTRRVGPLRRGPEAVASGLPPVRDDDRFV